MDPSYQPYVYQPMMRFFYGTPHESAINSLALWIKNVSPGAYAAVMTGKPHLFDPGRAVRSGMMGISAMSAAVDDNPTNPISEWGKQLLDVAKGYMAFDMQRDLLKVNIARAEKGLPPISSETIAPTMNLGISSDVQRLGMIAVGGLVIVGLLSALNRGRK